MLDLAVQHVNRLRPRFVVLTGDMQNTHPNSSGSFDAAQTADVQSSLSRLDLRLRATVPGNHDIDDAPTLGTIALYETRWGADRRAFDEGGVRFIALDSQLYVDASHPGVRGRAENQTAWLAAQLDAAAATAAPVVLLTHVPPFVVHADEPVGWANWPLEARQTVLGMSQQRQMPPSLIVAGHFHANVEDVHTTAFGAGVEVVTGSAVGCAIAWNGSEAPSYPHSLAQAIAREPDGVAAFQKYILRNGSLDAPADPALTAHRVVARANRSGVRLFEFDAAAGYRHRFYSLEQLATLVGPLPASPAASASPLADIAFTPWQRRR